MRASVRHIYYCGGLVAALGVASGAHAAVTPATPDVAARAQQVVQASAQVVGMAPRFSGRTLFETGLGGAMLAWNGDIHIDPSYIGPDAGQVCDVDTLLTHEAMHAVSVGALRPRDYEAHPGWEEGVAEGMRLQVQAAVLAQMGYAPSDVAQCAGGSGRSIYGVYTEHLTRIIRILRRDEAATYRALIRTPLVRRPAVVRRWAGAARNLTPAQRTYLRRMTSPGSPLNDAEPRMAATLASPMRTQHSTAVVRAVEATLGVRSGFSGRVWIEKHRNEVAATATGAIIIEPSFIDDSSDGRYYLDTALTRAALSLTSRARTQDPEIRDAYVGWEDGVVEGLRLLIQERVFSALGYGDDAARIAAQDAAGMTEYGAYRGELERLRAITGRDAEGFYRELLVMPLHRRPGAVRAWAVAAQARAADLAYVRRATSPRGILRREIYD